MRPPLVLEEPFSILPLGRPRLTSFRIFRRYKKARTTRTAGALATTRVSLVGDTLSGAPSCTPATLFRAVSLIAHSGISKTRISYVRIESFATMSLWRNRAGRDEPR